MTHTLENGKLTIFFERELNSYNSEEVEREIESIVDNNSFDSIVLDMENLRYISSAGLRIVVRLKQRFDNTSIVKVQESVYDIFDMVGFQNVISIEKL